MGVLLVARCRGSSLVACQVVLARWLNSVYWRKHNIAACRSSRQCSVCCSQFMCVSLAQTALNCQ